MAIPKFDGFVHYTGDDIWNDPFILPLKKVESFLRRKAQNGYAKSFPPSDPPRQEALTLPPVPFGYAAVVLRKSPYLDDGLYVTIAPGDDKAKQYRFSVGINSTHTVQVYYLKSSDVAPLLRNPEY